MAQINIFITTKGFFFLILVQVLSIQVLSLKHGKYLFRWEVQVHPHTAMIKPSAAAAMIGPAAAAAMDQRAAAACMIYPATAAAMIQPGANDAMI